MRNRFQTPHIVFHFLGGLLLVLAAILLVPLALFVIYAEWRQGYRTALAFVVPSAISALLGLLCRRVFHKGTPTVFQASLICALGWLACSAIGAVVFVIGIHASYLDGFFETMSGFTTTGITMFTGLDDMPRSVLFWRSLTQWIGGLGILTFFLALIELSGGAHTLFGAESHKIDVSRPVPGLINTVKILWTIYAAFTLVIIVGLLLVGVSLYDSVSHSFTALSTGGFSPYDASVDHYRQIGHPNYIWIEYILVLGMVLGGTNFVIHYRVLKGNGRALYKSQEMKFWWALIGLFVALIFAERLLVQNALQSGNGFWSTIELNFRVILFQVVGIITTTGFGTRDIGSPAADPVFFGTMAQQLFLVMMVIGGCVGSTGGGIKVLRVAILFELIRREIYRIVSPRRAVSTLVIDGKPVHLDEIQRVSGLFFAWILLLIVGGGATALLSSHSGYQCFSGMFSALGNIGPCYIPVSGMGELHPLVKVVYIFGMLAGRLEILPVLLLFSPRAWKS